MSRLYRSLNDDDIERYRTWFHVILGKMTMDELVELGKLITDNAEPSDSPTTNVEKSYKVFTIIVKKYEILRDIFSPMILFRIKKRHS